jgi:hypothetical protein
MVGFEVGFKVVSLCFWARRFPCFSMDCHLQAMVVPFPYSLSQGFKEAAMGITLFVSSLRICFLAPRSIAREGLLHDRSPASVARDESHMAGDYFWPNKSIHRCVCMPSHL